MRWGTWFLILFAAVLADTGSIHIDSLSGAAAWLLALAIGWCLRNDRAKDEEQHREGLRKLGARR